MHTLSIVKIFETQILHFWGGFAIMLNNINYTFYSNENIMMLGWESQLGILLKIVLEP